jgi:hypothetical protein
MTSNTKEINVVIEVLLKDSHPAIAEHSGYFCKQLGELLVQKTGEDRIRREIAKTMGLPEGVPFKLTVHAAHASHGDYRKAGQAKGTG